MSRIQNTFQALKEKNKKALIPFFTAGDPHPNETVNLMNALVDSGADMIELGIPFSDPEAEGPSIQKSSQSVVPRLRRPTFRSSLLRRLRGLAQ